MEQSVNTINLPFIEGLYADFLKDPESVTEDWRAYFRQIALSDPTALTLRLNPSFKPHSIFHPPGNGHDGKADGGNGAKTATAPPPVQQAHMQSLQDRVDQLVRAYRVRGHMAAQLDPLGRPRPRQSELDPVVYGLTESDLDRVFSSNTIYGPKFLTLREILTRLRNTYCRSIGVQFMHIDNFDVKSWLQERMEGSENRLELTVEEQLRILTRLTDAVIFEEFIQKKFMGAKSFSLEGAESLIPLLELAIEKAGEQRINEVVIGMAHRGRLNVLANILGKSPEDIFREYEDKDPDLLTGRGDVKYHLGYHRDWVTQSGHSVHLALCFNPSHLEFVNPVVLGRVRAKQVRLQDTEQEKYIALLIHGDAAFAGEGIVQETLNLSQIEGFSTGGTIHVVVNNQIGFTTSPNQGRSGMYATDIAKMLESPIFHVNGEDPEAVAQVINLAMEFRKTFKRDVVIDMYCYRRRGHNESDEPAFTQPVLYREIESRKSVRDGYLEHLMKLGQVSQEQADEISEMRKQELEKQLLMLRSEDSNSRHVRPSILGRVWRNYQGGKEDPTDDLDTGCERERLSWLLGKLTELPDDFKPHPKIQRLLELRREMARGEKMLDWSAGEALAFATLATEGVHIRLSGQDSERGTFSHRHSVLHDFEDGHTYTPLQHLVNGQAQVDILNSPLSEAGVLGYEYGYSIAYPDALVMWEAQFGDFWNAAQVIVDQFIVSAEDKWNSLSGLVMLLPHGFEGMGPEHSHARLERFLLMCAEHNIQVVNPTTPAQYFHCLRRQALRRWRKPLIVMTPKSLLRHPLVVSSLDELSAGKFNRILPDPSAPDPKKVEHIILCSGKIFYELDEARSKANQKNVAILRVEQLYPRSDEEIKAALKPYKKGVPVFWVQEEPENMGAWRHFALRLGSDIFGLHPFSCVSREASASPATGSGSSHRAEQAKIIEYALSGKNTHSIPIGQE